MTVTMTGWDLNPRILGIVPKHFKVAPFNGMTWVNDAHYMVVPKGIPKREARRGAGSHGVAAASRVAGADLRQGYFYPGPAIKNLTLSMAPKGKPGRAARVRPPRSTTRWLESFSAHAVRSSPRR